MIPLLLAAAAWGLLKARLAEPPRARYAVAENLVQSFLFGEFVATSGRMNLGSPRGQRHTVEADPRLRSLASGLLTRPGGKPPFALVVGHEATIDLDVNLAVDRRLVLRVGSAFADRQQTLTVHFNDELLGTTTLPIKEGMTLPVRHDVPAELQRRGSNRVRLVFDEVEEIKLHDMPYSLPLAAQVVSCHFLRPGEPEDVPPRADGGQELGVQGDPTPGAETRTVRVPAGVSARVTTRLPQASRVVLRLRIERIDTPFEISVLTDDGRRVQLARVDPRDIVPRELREDLTPWAGRAVQFDFWSREGEGHSVLSELAVVVPAEELESEGDELEDGDDTESAATDDPAGAADPEPADAAPQALDRPDVLLVVLDALARGQTSAFGVERPTTPVLEQLARRALVAESARAPASYTVASVGSLLTGLQPMAHGVVMGETQAGPQRLPEGTPRLASAFAEAGWRTAAWLTNPNTSSRHGFGEGFETYDELFADDALWDEGVDGLELAPRLASFLAEPGDAPRFSYVHVFEPHAPWRSNDELTERFVSPYEGPASGDREYLDAVRTGFVDPASVSEADRLHLVDLYAARMAWADHVLGTLLHALEASGRADQTVVLVTSDHGEALGQHGRYEHGDDVHAEQVDVPFLLVVPGRGAGRLPGPVTLEDVAPTLMGLAGLPVPEGLDGVDLLAGPVDAERVLLSRGYGARPVLGITLDGMRLLFDTNTRRRTLYDLRTDPGETSDVSTQNPVTADLLHAELCRRVAEAVARAQALVDPSLVDPDRLAVLKELGYLGADGEPEPGTEAFVLAALRLGLVRD